MPENLGKEDKGIERTLRVILLEFTQSESH